LFDGDTDSRPVMVSIRCITYNHEPYIRQTLEGFVMQKTNFRFEAIVHDDASTDGTAAIIREFAEKYPDIIRPIYEAENQYSKHDGSLGRIMDAAVRGKYVAFCEGDDYWTDPNKLQKQVDFLESHPDYSMVFTNAMDLLRSGKTIRHNTYISNRDVPIKDVILKNGDFIATASICCRASIYDNMPKEVTSQYVGDFPLQIYLAHIGKVRFLSDITTVYRRGAIGSWTVKTMYEKQTVEKLTQKLNNELKLITDMDAATDFKHSKYFRLYKNWFLWGYYKTIGNFKDERKYFFMQKHPIPGYSFKAYIYLLLRYAQIIRH
jgi:glycosyltransferase involved in cell wall biosynthesis